MMRKWHFTLLAMALVLLGVALNAISRQGPADDVALYRDSTREIYLHKGRLAHKSYDDGGTYLDASMLNIYRNETWMDIMEYSTWHIDPVKMMYKVSEITSCSLDGQTQET